MTMTHSILYSSCHAGLDRVHVVLFHLIALQRVSGNFKLKGGKFNSLFNISCSIKWKLSHFISLYI